MGPGDGTGSPARLTHRQQQLLALEHWAETELPLPAAFAALGIEGDGDSCSTASASSDLHAPTALKSAASMLPIRLIKLMAIRAMAAAAMRSAVGSCREAAVRLSQVTREARLAAAYDMALRLGIPKARLRHFRRLGVTGVTTAVLGPLKNKCRVVLALRALRAAVVWRQDLEVRGRCTCPTKLSPVLLCPAATVSRH